MQPDNLTLKHDRPQQKAPSQETPPVSEVKEVKKKRMTSPKNPISQYKYVLTKIFSYHQPIKSESHESATGNLYIGGSGVLESQILKKHKIAAVLTVIDYKKYEKQKISEKAEDIDQIQQHQYIDITEEHFDFSPYLDHSFHFIDEVLGRGCNLLVHSNDGLSRAPAIVVGFLMRKYQLSFDDAYQIIKKRKPEVEVKATFIDQLKALEILKPQN